MVEEGSAFHPDDPTSVRHGNPLSLGETVGGTSLMSVIGSTSDDEETGQTSSGHRLTDVFLVMVPDLIIRDSAH